MQNITLAYVVDRVTERYGRPKVKVKARLVGDLNAWIDRMCRRFNFWFLHQDPGMYVFSQFPMASATPPSTNFANLTPVLGQWVDKGWLLLVPGQAAYPFAYPINECWDATQAVPTVNTGWVYGEIQKISNVKQFGYSGDFLRDIAVCSYADMLTHQSYAKPAVPLAVTFQTVNGQSILHFSPTPDQAYLYCIRTKLATMPPLGRADSTNAFLTYYPEAVICAGLLQQAEYFHEPQEMQQYAAKLYGAEYSQLMDPCKATPGGLIGEIIADTRSRNKSEASTMRVYGSTARALGRDNGQRRLQWSNAGYYGPL